LYSEPEFGPIAAKMTGDLDAPELLAAVEVLPPAAALDELELEHAATVSVAAVTRAASAAYLVFLLMRIYPFYALQWCNQPAAVRRAATPGPGRPGVS
jgi:hypothetical protein